MLSDELMEKLRDRLDWADRMGMACDGFDSLLTRSDCGWRLYLTFTGDRGKMDYANSEHVVSVLNKGKVKLPEEMPKSEPPKSKKSKSKCKCERIEMPRSKE